jgi:Holliday junction resolvase RusA-like endonuclease
MTFMLQFHIDAEPVPKGRPKFSKVGGFMRAYTPKKTSDYESIVRATAQQAMGPTDLLETALGVYLYIRLPIPQSHSKKRKEACLSGQEKPIKKPDIDNLAKSVLDGMNGVIWKDDSQIVSLHVTKVYSSGSGVDVLVKEELE